LAVDPSSAGQVADAFAGDQSAALKFATDYQVYLPPVYVAGPVVERSFAEAIRLGLVTLEQELSHHRVSVYRFRGGPRFVAIQDVPHPSAQLMSHRSPESMEKFRVATKVAKGALRCCAAGDVNPRTMLASVLAALEVDPEADRQQREGRLFLINMLYSDAHAEGRFKPEHMHLRHVKAHLAPVQAFLRDWEEERGMESLRAILFNGISTGTCPRMPTS
jgi:hypothetical protein